MNSKIDKYQPNGTPEEVNLNILHSVDGYYISNEGTKEKPIFYVWVPDLTHAISDSAYNDITLSVARCNYLAKNNTKMKYQPS